MDLLEGFVNEDTVVLSGENVTSDNQGNNYGYVSSVEELDLGRYSGLGMGVAGTGLLMSLLVVSVISWLKRG